MLRVLLIRPGSTEFDEQGRIKGTLDIPLTDLGIEQVRRTADELQDENIRVIYTAPGLPAKQSADIIADVIQSKVKTLQKLKNVDRGLWEGMLMEHLRTTQPRVFRQWREQPDSVCPPNGETMQSARQRLRKCLARLIRKHAEDETIAIVAIEPVASIVYETLSGESIGESVELECTSGSWNLIELSPGLLAI